MDRVGRSRVIAQFYFAMKIRGSVDYYHTEQQGLFFRGGRKKENLY